MYIKESKYRGNRDSFNFKLTIFYNIYGCVNILYKAKAKVFPIMLKSLVLDFFYLNNTIIIIHFIYSPMRFPYRSIQTILAIIRRILPCPFGGKNLASV